MTTKGPVGPSTYPQYVKGPQGNLIGIRGPVQMYPGPILTGPPIYSPPAYDIPSDVPVRHPPIIYPPDKPIRPIRPMPPIRVGPVHPTPPVYQPHYRRRRRHPQPYRGGVMLQPGHHYGRRRHPYPVMPHPPIKVAPDPIVAPPILPILPIVPTGKTCPTWGWMVRTNADGSETVIACTPGQPGAAGLHGLESITGTLQGALGPNWMLYIGAGLAAWYFMKKR